MTKIRTIPLILVICVFFTSLAFDSISRADEHGLKLTASEAKLIGRQTLMDENQAKRAVVKIVATSTQGAKDIGAGIYLGKIGSWVYAMTAFHVVRVAGGGGTLDVYCYGFLGRPQPAEFIMGDEGLDLSVIRFQFPSLEFTDGLLPFATGLADKLGELRKGKLGITVSREITSAQVSKYRLVSTNGVLVQGVAQGSVGMQAGIQKGDLIFALNDVPITGAMDLGERIKAMPNRSNAVFDIYRRNTRLQIRTRLGDAADKPNSAILSLGHPASQDWNWQAGYIFNSQDPTFLSISTSLSESGISGGPLLDNKYKLIGIVLRQGDRKDTALRIEIALERIAQWRIPFRLWLTDTFCTPLKQVLDDSKSDFASLKVGAGQAETGYSEWKWSSKIDLSGQQKSEVVRLDYGRHRFEAVMADNSYGEEAEALMREIARAVKRCIPDSHVGRNEYGFKITFKEGFWGTPQPIEIYKFGSYIYLRIPSI